MPADSSPALVRLVGLERSDHVQTYEQLAETVRRVQAALEARGLRCRPNSALGFIFKKAHRLSENWKSGQEGILTLMQADDAIRIAAAVEGAFDEPGATQAIQRITKSDMHLTTRQLSQGKDALWELDLLSYLKKQGVPVCMQEPDLVVDLPSPWGAYGIACKKVYGENSVASQLRKGCHQLRATGNPGVVAFNLDDITPEKSILVQPTRQAANEFLYRRNLAFLRRHQEEFEESVMKGQCDGVLLSTTSQADIAGMSPRFNRITELTLWTVSEANAGVHLRYAALRQLIEREG